ncbi:MAG: hypothetical protein WCP45_07985 [Verrucomicrobiota bacterium]
MKTQDLMTVVTVAVATASLTVMTFWSGALNAGDDANKPAAQIAKPKLLAHGIEMTLAAVDGRTLSAGEEPVFELTAVNTTGEATTASIHIAMTASSPRDMMSRVPRLPSALWQHEQPLVLQPNETKVIQIPAAAKLPANSMIAVSLGEAGATPAVAATAGPELKLLLLRAGGPLSGIVAMNFSTAVPAVPTATANNSLRN